MEIVRAQAGDVEGWMTLVEAVRKGFPGLDTPEAMREHRLAVLEFIARGEALCAREQGRVVGALLFSREARMLCFLAVDPAWRRRHIAEGLLEAMLNCLPPEGPVTVTTYRAGVPEGIAARAFYRKMGFEEGRLTEEFGAPVQEFVLRR